MQFSMSLRAILSTIVASALCVSAAPTSQQNPDTPMKMGAAAKASGRVAGAAYFLTNEPNGNFIVSSDIATDGKVTLRRAVGSGGHGAHGITDPNGPDPLFSQGAIKTSAASNIVAAVNAGSNTVSLFGINPNKPSHIHRIGAPASTEGEFPVSLAINKSGERVCVANSGKVNGVSCFTADKKAGLKLIQNSVRSLNLNQTTPATGPANTVSHIIFSEDNTKLIVSVKGLPPAPGFLAMWDVAEDGSLSEKFNAIAPEAGGLLPFSMTVIPGKNAVLATDAGVGFDLFDLSGANGTAQGKADEANLAPGAVTAGGKSSVVPIEGQGATCWSSFSPKTGNFYLTDIATSLITEVNVDADLKGTIVKQYPQGAEASTIDNDIATIGDKDFMYVMSANATRIEVLALNGPGGAVNIQRVDIAGPAARAGLKVDALNLQGMTTFIRK